MIYKSIKTPFFSDGAGSPSQAYVYARDVARLDFFSLADHSEQIDATEWNNPNGLFP
ncbi:MAG: hypothetical protein K6U80_13475 [Firmicutes bacterium]|nr:hypothetical protein [Bacillota bacterium]